jgi:hypothetical protein
MTLSAEQLVAIARDHWPSSKEPYLRQERSPEQARLQEKWERALARMDRWWKLLEELEGELPGFTMGDGTATPGACLRCVAYPVRSEPPPRFRWVVVGCVSILAPVYMVYGVQLEYSGTKRIGETAGFEPLPPELRAPADIIARKLEATLGVRPLPRELAELRVPLFVEWKEPPATTLFHALFSSRPERVP